MDLAHAVPLEPLADGKVALLKVLEVNLLTLLNERIDYVCLSALLELAVQEGID